ncbi:MAG TPA: hypothetical protein VF420_16265 [Casimicrobiaceae bacterium]
MNIDLRLEFLDGIAECRPRGECSLVEAVDMVKRAIASCRRSEIAKLLFDGTGLTGIPIPTLVDRFLAAEEWAEAAQGMVFVVLVIHTQYIHPEKFGVRVARQFGLTCDVYDSEADARKWLSTAHTS